MTAPHELTKLTARQAVNLLRKRVVSPMEMVEAAIARIEAVDGDINALPIRCFERAHTAATHFDNFRSSGVRENPGYLAGLPIAIKDLCDVSDVPTTYGCPVTRDKVALMSDPHVMRLEWRGAIVMGKSNTPELGMLPVTDNRVFGPTRNPWSIDLTAGGSSGGAAAALAAGEVWLADGSDIAGSLRIPAALCGVVGFRPSPGLVPRAQQPRMFNPLAVLGPMARTVGDIALFMDAMVGLDPADPLSRPAPATSFQASVDRAVPPTRVAFVPSLGLGQTDPEVADLAQGAALRLEQAGTRVDLTAPDFSGIDRAFRIILGFAFASGRGAFVDAHADALEPHLPAFLSAVRSFTMDDLLWAERRRAQLWSDLQSFFLTHEFLLMPTLGRVAFPVSERGPSAPHVDGWLAGEMPGWFHPCWATALTACPAISIPCGFTRAGLPVGLQILGPGHGDAGVLALAALLETLLELPTALPLDPRGPVEM